MKTTHVALLRGVNVGGRGKVPMAGLRALLAELGFEDVVTYIQSGNAVFRATGAERAIATRIERAVADEFGVDSKVLVRTPAQLNAAAKSNPFLKGKADRSKLHVVFLGDRPPAKALRELDPERSPGDEFHVRGREIYLHLPKGVGRTKLTIDYFERLLGVDATKRNWNTLLKLVELSG